MIRFPLIFFMFMIKTSNTFEVYIKETVFIKHYCKVINHGFFSFCNIKKDNTITRTTFSYSLNAKKKTFVVMFLDSSNIQIDRINKYDFDGFQNSESWNEKRIGSSIEKHFLVFHLDFLKWDNMEKMDFFNHACKNMSH